MVGSYLFGGLTDLQFRLRIYRNTSFLNTDNFQAYGIILPSTILEMIPYVFTIIVLTITSARELAQKIGAPKALGNAYERESRD